MTSGQTERPAETDLIHLFPFVIGACYVAGLLIVNIELARHGVWDFELGRAQYVLVGVLWLVLAGLGIVWLIFAFMIVQRVGFGSLPPRPFTLRKLVSLPLTVAGRIILIAICQVLNFSAFVYLPILLLSNDPDNVYWVIALFIMNSVLMITPIAGLSGIAGRTLRVPALSNFVRDHEDDPLSVAFGCGILLMALAFYAVGLYPALSRTLGGGAPSTVRIVLKDPIVAPWPRGIWTSPDAKRIGPASLLEETSESISVAAVQKFDPDVSMSRAAPAIQIEKAQIALILHAPDLGNDNVLIAGGQTDQQEQGAFLSIYDEFHRRFYSPSLPQDSVGRSARASSTLTVMDPSSSILVAGGYDAKGESLRTAYTFQKGDKSWGIGPNLQMTSARGEHAAARTPNGYILVSGGRNGAQILQSAELFGWFKGDLRFLETGKLVFARYRHAATALRNDTGPLAGDVLISGGLGPAGFVGAAEIYESTRDEFRATGTLNNPRADHRAVLLDNGSVLITGGIGAEGILDSAEIYEPGAGTFAITGRMIAGRQGHTATVLNDGSVLVTGGRTGGGAQSSAEIYDPREGVFTPAGHMTTPREGHTATLLNDGRVLIAGGRDEKGRLLASTEIFDDWTHEFTASWRMTGPAYNSQAGLFQP